MERKTKNWLLIILGVVILVVVLGVAAVVGFGYYMYRQMNVTTSTSGDLEQQFAEIQSRFNGQVPYIEASLKDDADPIVHHEMEKSTRTKLQWLHVAIYDPRDHRVVQLRLPFWLLRLGGGNHPINLRAHSGINWDDSRVKLTPEDLERRGPGLVLDATGRRDEHVIIWSE